MLFEESLWTTLIVHYHILAVALVFGKICKICHYWMVCAYLFSTSWILLSLLILEWLGCWRQQWYQLIALSCRDAEMIKFHLEYSTIMFSISWKRMSFFGVFACFYTRSLIFVLCFCYLFLEDIFSLRGCIPSSFPWFVNTRFQSSCL